MDKINIKLILLFCINLFFCNQVLSQQDSIHYFVVRNIQITGNKITKEKIILNEVLFEKGDSIDTSKIKDIINQSCENLLNKSLFNFVTINYDIENAELYFLINVEERWYMWPGASLKFEDRNFNSWLENKDFTRVTLGAGVVKYNFRGLNQKVNVNITVGYIQKLTLIYDNLYLDKNRKHSLSFNIYYQRQHNISYLTQNNKLEDVKLEDNYAFKKTELLVIYKFRPTLNETHTIFLKSQDIQINDSVFLLNNNYLGGKKKLQYLHFLYEYEINKKDNKSYPLKGYYLKLGLQKSGFLFSFEEINTGYIAISASKFIQLKHRFYFASQINSKIYFPLNQPYFSETALGYEYFIRGYEYYVIDGNLFFLNRNSLKYEALSKTIINLKFLPFKKFNKIHLSSYITLNFDYGFVSDFSKKYIIYNNYLSNTFLYGFGIGIDFVTYYDKVLRIEYSINNSSERGIYLHFKSVF